MERQINGKLRRRLCLSSIWQMWAAVISNNLKEHLINLDVTIKITNQKRFSQNTTRITQVDSITNNFPR
jgi:hypothetical protein